MAFARRVFPVPGGPTKSTPLGIFAPTAVNLSGFFKNSTTYEWQNQRMYMCYTLWKVGNCLYKALIKSGDEAECWLAVNVVGFVMNMKNMKNIRRCCIKWKRIVVYGQRYTAWCLIVKQEILQVQRHEIVPRNFSFLTNRSPQPHWMCSRICQFVLEHWAFVIQTAASVVRKFAGPSDLEFWLGTLPPWSPAWLHQLQQHRQTWFLCWVPSGILPCSFQTA